MLRRNLLKSCITSLVLPFASLGKLLSASQDNTNHLPVIEFDSKGHIANLEHLKQYDIKFGKLDNFIKFAKEIMGYNNHSHLSQSNWEWLFSINYHIKAYSNNWIGGACVDNYPSVIKGDVIIIMYKANNSYYIRELPESIRLPNVMRSFTG